MGLLLPQYRTLLGGGALPPYLLYDAFTDTLAAGSVNGTPATPPAGVAIVGAAPTRTVTDTNSKLSVGSGILTALTGGAGGQDPSIIYATLSRVSGRTLLGVMTTSVTGGTFEFCVNVNAESIRFKNSTTLNVRHASGETVLGLPYATATQYSLAIVLKASGMYCFIKGGIYSNYTLIWIASTGSSTIAPSASVLSGAAPFTLDNIRIPVALYTVPCLAYDTFTRADGVLGSSETSGPDAQATQALAWTSQAGTWGVATNKAAASALAGGLALATVSTPSADVLLDATCTRAAGVVGLVARYQSATDYLIAYHDGTNCKLDKVVAGVTTNLISAAVAIGAGGLRLVLSGTSAWLFLNGVAVGSVATVPSSTQTAHGLYTTDTGATFDNLQIMARGTSNEYGGLDAF